MYNHSEMEFEEEEKNEGKPLVKKHWTSNGLVESDPRFNMEKRQLKAIPKKKF